MNPVHVPYPVSFKILVNIIISCTDVSQLVSCLQGFPTKICYAFLNSPLHVTCPTYLILLYIMTLIIFSEECKSWSSSLCSFLGPLFLASLSFMHLLSERYETPSVCVLPSSLTVRVQVSHPYRTSHTHTYSAESENKLSCTSIPPIRLHDMVLS